MCIHAKIRAQTSCTTVYTDEIVKRLMFFKLKTSHPLWLYTLVCVFVSKVVKTPEDRFSHDEDHMV